MEPSLPTIRPAGQEKIIRYLDTLSQNPPSSILLEGGDSAVRFSLGLYWTARLNCPEPSAPCETCPVCLQVKEQVFRDMEVLDGRQGQILIEDVRKVRTLMSRPPQSRGTRVIILAEAQNMDAPAANVLLKSMEEPAPGNVFILLAPQRGTLLPTLVSRSFVLTLPWKQQTHVAENVLEWETALLHFLTTQQGWFARTGKKNNVDGNLAQHLLLRLQRGVLLASRGETSTALSHYLAQQPSLPRDRMGSILSHGLACLEKRANPALVLDWVAVRLLGLLAKR